MDKFGNRRDGKCGERAISEIHFRLLSARCMGSPPVHTSSTKGISEILQSTMAAHPSRPQILGSRGEVRSYTGGANAPASALVAPFSGNGKPAVPVIQCGLSSPGLGDDEGERCGGGTGAPVGGRLLPGGGPSGVGRSPTPDRPSLGRAAGARYPLALGAGGVGVETRHQPHCARSCEPALRAVGVARGRPGGAALPGCGASGDGRSPSPDRPSLGRAAGVRYPLAVGAGGVGVGTRPRPHSAHSCELALRAVRAARGRLGGASLAVVWGVRGRALFHGRPPVLGACGRGPLPTGCGCGGCGRGDPSPTPQRALLRAGFARCWGGTWAPRGGRLLPGCGASGVERSPTPARPSLGRVAGARYPPVVGAVCGRRGPAVLGTFSRAAVRRVLCALPGSAAPGGRCCLAPVLVPWLWPAACLSGVPRGPALVRRASSCPVALGAPVGFPVTVVPSPTPGAVVPGCTGRLRGARGGRPRTRLIVPAAGPCRGRGAGLGPRRTRSGPRDGVVPGGSLRLRSWAACAAVVWCVWTRSLTRPVSCTVRLSTGDSAGAPWLFRVDADTSPFRSEDPTPGSRARVPVHALLGRVGRAGLPGAFWCVSPFLWPFCPSSLFGPPPGWGCPCFGGFFFFFFPLLSFFSPLAPPLSPAFCASRPRMPLLGTRMAPTRN